MLRKYALSVGMLAGLITFSGFATPLGLGDAKKGNSHVPWWVWVLALFILVFLLAWWWERREQETILPAAQQERAREDVDRSVTNSPGPAVPVEKRLDSVVASPSSETFPEPGEVTAAAATSAESEAVSPETVVPSEAPAATAEAAVPPESAVATTEEIPTEETPPVKADDLKIIEGIGPKIASLLNEAGIMTFQQLADSDVEALRAILNAPRFRLADPTTWPQQAALAARGAWDELATLQKELKGGRRA